MFAEWAFPIKGLRVSVAKGVHEPPVGLVDQIHEWAGAIALGIP